MNTIDHALRLCARLPVFPCREDKKPACKHGFKDAVRDPQRVAELWRQSPGPLIGVPTGAASGFDVLDIDPRHGGDRWLAEARDSLPVTRIQHTRSGGQHILFRHADGVRNTASKIAAGVDTRGDGGYIVWWPATGCAVENNRALADWPRWVLKLLLPQPPKPRDVAAAPRIGRDAPEPVARILAATLTRLETAMPGQRHSRLRAAAATLGGLADAAGFSDAEAEQVLLAAVLRAGGADVDEKNATGTIRWGLDRGRRSPLQVRG